MEPGVERKAELRDQRPTKVPSPGTGRRKLTAAALVSFTECVNEVPSPLPGFGSCSYEALPPGFRTI